MRDEVLVQANDVQHVQKLPFVLVDTLHLDVEQGIRIHLQAVAAFFDDDGQFLLVEALDLAPALPEVWIIRKAIAGYFLIWVFVRPKFCLHPRRKIPVEALCVAIPSISPIRLQ